MFKEVIFDPKTQLEETVRLWQEVYDDAGKTRGYLSQVESYQALLRAAWVSS